LVGRVRVGFQLAPFSVFSAEVRHVHQVGEKSRLEVKIGDDEFGTGGARCRGDEEIAGSHALTVIHQLVLYPRGFEGDLVVEFERLNATEILPDRDDIGGPSTDFPVEHLEDAERGREVGLSAVLDELTVSGTPSSMSMTTEVSRKITAQNSLASA